MDIKNRAKVDVFLNEWDSVVLLKREGENVGKYEVLKIGEDFNVFLPEDGFASLVARIEGKQ